MFFCLACNTGPENWHILFNKSLTYLKRYNGDLHMGLCYCGKSHRSRRYRHNTWVRLENQSLVYFEKDVVIRVLNGEAVRLTLNKCFFCLWLNFGFCCTPPACSFVRWQDVNFILQPPCYKREMFVVLKAISWATIVLRLNLCASSLLFRCGCWEL